MSVKKEIETDEVILTTAQLAEIFNLTNRRVTGLAKEGILPRFGHGKYLLSEAVPGYVGYLQSRANTRGEQDLDIEDEKVRLAKAQADKMELEVAKARLQVVNTKEVEAVWGRLIGAFRAKILAIPSKLAPRVVAGKSVPEIEEILTSEIHEAMIELSNYDIKQFDPDFEESIVSHQASAEADSQPVGGQVPPPKPRGKRRARKVAN